MPFTPSHIAAVLGLRRIGVELPLAALAVGSMSPDLPYFLPGLTELGSASHHPWAVVSLDVMSGLALWAVWRLIASPLHALVPTPIRERWTPAGWRSAKWWTVGLALAIGAATHVAWDSFTHAGRFGSTHLAFLAASYPSPTGHWPGYEYAQYFSGAIGLAIIVWAGRRQPRRVVEPRTKSAWAIALPWVTVVAGLAGAGCRIFASGTLKAGAGALAFSALTGSIGAAALAAAAVCWGYALARRRASTGERPVSTAAPVA